MSLFRIGGAAGLRATRLAAPVNVRFVSHGAKGEIKTSPADAPSTPNRDSSLINKQSPSEAMTRHQPDYEATIDHATSYDTSHCSSPQTQFANMFFFASQSILPRSQARDGWQRAWSYSTRCSSLWSSYRSSGPHRPVLSLPSRNVISGRSQLLTPRLS
jgi:hypothetical protein